MSISQKIHVRDLRRVQEGYLAENEFHEREGGAGQDGFRENKTLELRTEVSIDICFTDIGKKGTLSTGKSMCINMPAS